MIIREFRSSDLAALRQIHESFYKNEFEFPDWVNGFIAAFIVADDNDKPITAGGIRPILEAIAITDKSFSSRVRRAALNQILSASSYVAKNCNHNQLHAFIQANGWECQLLKHGFKPCKGKALYLNL